MKLEIAFSIVAFFAFLSTSLVTWLAIENKGMKMRLMKLEAKDEFFSEKIAIMSIRISNHISDIKTIKADIDDVSNDVSDIVERFAEVSKMIEELKEKYKELSEEIDMAESRVAGKVERTLDETIGKMIDYDPFHKGD